MAKRIKKAAIRPEQRRDWLRRQEEQEESTPAIALQDNYDVRTVRKAIELARAEREMREARTLVLRNAIEKHYKDLRQYAERMDGEVLGTDSSAPSSDNDFVESALKQHLPRSPIWSLQSKRKALKEKEVEQRQRLKQSVENSVGRHSQLATLSTYGLSGVIPGVAAAIMVEVGIWTRGDADSSFKDRLTYEPVNAGTVNPRFGVAHLGAMDEEIARREMPKVRRALEELEISTKDSIEFRDLAKTLADLKQVDRKLREELAIIRLRRIVPGRCKYCPL
jgi:hypothetical protein